MNAKSLPSVLTALGADHVSNEPDAELLDRFVVDRDQRAFTELVHRYGRLVWRVARTRCRSDATAEDVFQAAFVVLAQRAGSIRRAGALAGWLHRTAHRLAVRAAKNERRVIPISSDPPVSADPLDTLSARELLAAVDEELAQLSDTERAVLVLCGVDGLSNDDAAARLGWTLGAVKGRLERARAKLRARLGARGLPVPLALGLVGTTVSVTAVRAAVLIPHGGAISPRVQGLASEVMAMEGTRMKGITVAVLTIIGIGVGMSHALQIGRADAGAAPPVALPQPQSTAERISTRAPVPKVANRLIWSEPTRVNWEASQIEQMNGVWTPDGKAVIVPAHSLSGKGEALPGGGVDMRDAANGRVTQSLRYVTNSDTAAFQPTVLAVSPDGKTVLAEGAIFEVGKKAKLIRTLFAWPGLKDKDRTELKIGHPLAAVAVSPNGKFVTVVERTNFTVHLELAQFKPRHAFSFPETPKDAQRTGLAYHPSGRYYVACTEAGDIYAMASDEIVGNQGQIIIEPFGQLIGYDAKFRAVAVSPDGKCVAGGAPGKTKQSLMVIDDTNEAPIGNKSRTFTDAVPEKEAINGLAFSPDSKHLAAACTDGIVRVFEVKTGKLSASAKEHTAAVFSVAYSPDGTRLLTVGRDAYKVWKVEELMKAK